MRLSRVLTASLSAALIAGATLLAAPSASADQIWYQGVGRASADAPCPTSSAADLKAGWSEWTPSWAQWANGGKGGYVCTRAITWAYESTGGGGNCVLVLPTESAYVQFLNGWSYPMGSDVVAYLDPACTHYGGTFTDIDVNVVWAPGGEDQAQARCEEAFGEDFVAFHPEELGPQIFICAVPG